jgi:glycolate oxidase iron-sulfur subunit
LLQPEIANRLRDRKLANIAAVDAAVVATGNIGCISQLGGAANVPVVHTVELLDWATGGPRPRAMRGNRGQTEVFSAIPNSR